MICILHKPNVSDEYPHSGGNFGSRRAGYLNLASIPPEIDTPDTPDQSMFRVDVILDEKPNMAADP